MWVVSRIAQLREIAIETASGGVAFGLDVGEGYSVFVPPVFQGGDDVVAVGGDVVVQMGGQILVPDSDHELLLLRPGQCRPRLIQSRDEVRLQLALSLPHGHQFGLEAFQLSRADLLLVSRLVVLALYQDGGCLDLRVDFGSLRLHRGQLVQVLGEQL